MSSAYYFYDSNNYHKEYFSEDYCSVIDDAEYVNNSLKSALFVLDSIHKSNAISNKKNDIKILKASILGVSSIGNSDNEKPKETIIEIKVFEKALEKAHLDLIKKKHIPSQLPVDKKYSAIASPFGNRKHPILNVSKIHEGVDFDVPYGENVYAGGNGTITYAGYMKGYGKLIKIGHSYKYESRYGHLSKLLVKKGQTVKKGDLIAKVGNTGLSTTAHLHYEIRVNGKAVNPVNYYNGNISLPEYVKLLKLVKKK